MTKTTICKLETCAVPIGKHGAKGYCREHYGRYKRHGDPEKIEKRMNEGRKKHPLYNIYKKMRNRCHSENSVDYENYGGRGITVCDRWNGLDGFWVFVKDMGERPKGTTLDRIDNDGEYSPENCRWATPIQQVLNRRMQSNNTSGVEGVYYRKDSGKWRALIGVKGKLLGLGTYSEKSEAIKARKEAEQKYFAGAISC